jgi:hypothetical protein
MLSESTLYLSNEAIHHPAITSRRHLSNGRPQKVDE